MDPEKIHAITEWPTPTNNKQAQRFLGFAIFYCKFIRNFSSVAAPLHALTSQKTHFLLSDQADRAFQTLKERFTSAPVLSLPDTNLQFVVEVGRSCTLTEEPI